MGEGRMRRGGDMLRDRNPDLVALLDIAPLGVDLLVELYHMSTWKYMHS